MKHLPASQASKYLFSPDDRTEVLVVSVWYLAIKLNYTPRSFEGR